MLNNHLTLLREDAERALRRVPFHFLTGKTILLTGASGLVGTHFLAGLLHVQRLVGPGLEIHAIMHKTIPDHIRSMAADGRIVFHQGDMSDSSFLSQLPTADIIIHAATYGQPSLFSSQPQTTLKLNTTATFALLDKVKEGGTFLFLSSSEVYSGLSNPPFSENQIGTTNTDHARACYIEGKRSGEAICNCYNERGVNAKSVRLALAFGPGTRPDDRRVINTFIQKALCSGEIRLLDQGTARRTYCYVADALEMMWLILLKGTYNRYNVGGKSQTTIMELAKMIGQIAAVPIIIPPSDQSTLSGAPDDVRMDISRFESEFFSMDFMPFRQGLERTMAWQKHFYTA